MDEGVLEDVVVTVVAMKMMEVGGGGVGRGGA